VRRLIHSQYCNLTAIVLSCGLFCTGIQLATVILAGIRLNRKTLIVGYYRNTYPQSSLHQLATDWPELLSDYKDRTPS